MEKYKIFAIRTCQREKTAEGQAIYTGKIAAKDLINEKNLDESRFLVDQWTSEVKENRGYQRFPAEKNINKIKNYLIEETPNPLFPTTVLVNSRTALKFKELNDNYGELEIENTLYLIDGQHRVEALKELMREPKLRAIFGTFELPIVILSGFKYKEEVEQFFIINSRQTKIKTDLAQRLYIEMAKSEGVSKLVPESKRWQQLGGTVVDYLNEESNTIWFGRIQLPDDSKDIAKTRIITQNSFITSLKPFFSGGKRVWNYNATLPEKKHEITDQLLDLLTKFWKMVCEVYPNIYNNPKKYSLFKSLGVYVMHILLADVISDAQVFNIDAIVETAKKKLTYARDECEFKESFWEVGNKDAANKGRNASAYSNAVGHNRIAVAIERGRKINEL